jgi:hypothetical protein
MKQSTIEIPPWGWIIFGFVVVILLAIDHIAHRGARKKSRLPLAKKGHDARHLKRNTRR